MPARVCLSCGGLTSKPSRRGLCPDCQADWEQARTSRLVYDDPRWRAISTRAINAWVRQHGWNCPGYGREPHPSLDLTADHPEALALGGAALPRWQELEVLCRACNSRKGAAPPATKRSTT